MNLQKLPIGTIIVSNNTRLIITGYNNAQQDSYLVCVCNNNGITTNKAYGLLSSQIEKVLSLGYVELDGVTNNKVAIPQVVAPTPAPAPAPTGTGKFVFDANGFVIGEN